MGVGVVVGGESSARGMELVTRSEARGRCFVNCGGGGFVDAEGGDDAGAGGGGGGRASWAFWSHAARAEGSTGQAEGGGLLGGDSTLLDEVLPILQLCSLNARFLQPVKSAAKFRCFVTDFASFFPMYHHPLRIDRKYLLRDYSSRVGCWLTAADNTPSRMPRCLR